MSAAHLQSVLAEVAAERARQTAKFGEQRNPDGTGRRSWAKAHVPLASQARAHVERRAELGLVTDAEILLEEVAEAFTEHTPRKLRGELVQVAAVAVRWIQRLDDEAAERGESLQGEPADAPRAKPPTPLTLAHQVQRALLRTVASLENKLLEARQLARNLAIDVRSTPTVRGVAIEQRVAEALRWGEWIQEQRHLWRSQ